MFFCQNKMIIKTKQQQILLISFYVFISYHGRDVSFHSFNTSKHHFRNFSPFSNFFFPLLSFSSLSTLPNVCMFYYIHTKLLTRHTHTYTHTNLLLQDTSSFMNYTFFFYYDSFS